MVDIELFEFSVLESPAVKKGPSTPQRRSKRLTSPSPSEEEIVLEKKPRGRKLSISEKMEVIKESDEEEKLKNVREKVTAAPDIPEEEENTPLENGKSKVPESQIDHETPIVKEKNQKDFGTEVSLTDFIKKTEDKSQSPSEKGSDKENAELILDEAEVKILPTNEREKGRLSLKKQVVETETNENFKEKIDNKIELGEKEKSDITIAEPDDGKSEVIEVGEKQEATLLTKTTASGETSVSTKSTEETEVEIEKESKSVNVVTAADVGMKSTMDKLVSEVEKSENKSPLGKGIIIRDVKVILSPNDRMAADKSPHNTKTASRNLAKTFSPKVEGLPLSEKNVVGIDEIGKQDIAIEQENHQKKSGTDDNENETPRKILGDAENLKYPVIDGSDGSFTLNLSSSIINNTQNENTSLNTSSSSEKENDAPLEVTKNERKVDTPKETNKHEDCSEPMETESFINVTITAGQLNDTKILETPTIERNDDLVTKEAELNLDKPSSLEEIDERVEVFSDSKNEVSVDKADTEKSRQESRLTKRENLLSVSLSEESVLQNQPEEKSPLSKSWDMQTGITINEEYITKRKQENLDELPGWKKNIDMCTSTPAKKNTSPQKKVNAKKDDEQIDSPEKEISTAMKKTSSQQKKVITEVDKEETESPEETDSVLTKRNSSPQKQLNIGKEEETESPENRNSTPSKKTTPLKTANVVKAKEGKQQKANSPAKSKTIDAEIDELIENNKDEDEESVTSLLDLEAEEGEEDTPSEDSNQIIDEGESINTTSSEYGSSDDYENDSFIDDNEETTLLSGEEYDIHDLKLKKKRKGSRIIPPSESDEDNETVEEKTSENAEKEPRRKSKLSTIESSEENSDDDGPEMLIYSPETVEEQEPKEKLSSDDTDEPDVETTEQITTQPESEIKKSVVVLQNVKMEDVKSQQIINQITVVVDKFFTDINNDDGEVRINLSLDYSNVSLRDTEEAEQKSIPKPELKKKRTSREDSGLLIEDKEKDTEEAEQKTTLRTESKKKRKSLQDSSGLIEDKESYTEEVEQKSILKPDSKNKRKSREDSSNLIEDKESDSEEVEQKSIQKPESKKKRKSQEKSSKLIEDEELEKEPSASLLFKPKKKKEKLDESHSTANEQNDLTVTQISLDKIKHSKKAKKTESPEDATIDVEFNESVLRSKEKSPKQLSEQWTVSEETKQKKKKKRARSFVDQPQEESDATDDQTPYSKKQENQEEIKEVMIQKKKRKSKDRQVEEFSANEGHVVESETHKEEGEIQDENEKRKQKRKSPGVENELFTVEKQSVHTEIQIAETEVEEKINKKNKKRKIKTDFDLPEEAKEGEAVDSENQTKTSHKKLNKRAKLDNKTDIAKKTGMTEFSKAPKFLPSKQACVMEDVKIEYFPSNLLSKMIEQEEKKKKSKRPSILIPKQSSSPSWEIEPVTAAESLITPSGNDIIDDNQARKSKDKKKKSVQKSKKGNSPPGSVHPKDFKTQLLYDPGRVKRMDTKVLMKKKLLK